MSDLHVSLAHIGPCHARNGKTYTLHMVNGNGECRDCGWCPPVRVNWKHIDGPLMTLADGQLKWLTLRERFMHWIGRWSLEDIAKRPSL
jgi:hypothetical protein